MNRYSLTHAPMTHMLFFYCFCTLSYYPRIYDKVVLLYFAITLFDEYCLPALMLVFWPLSNLAPSTQTTFGVCVQPKMFTFTIIDFGGADLLGRKPNILEYTGSRDRWHFRTI